MADMGKSRRISDEPVASRGMQACGGTSSPSPGCPSRLGRPCLVGCGHEGAGRRLACRGLGLRHSILGHPTWGLITVSQLGLQRCGRGRVGADGCCSLPSLRPAGPLHRLPGEGRSCSCPSPVPGHPCRGGSLRSRGGCPGGSLLAFLPLLGWQHPRGAILDDAALAGGIGEAAWAGGGSPRSLRTPTQTPHTGQGPVPAV